MDTQIAGIEGIFSSLLEKCADWFLYIFIDENASVSSAIKAKRKNQLKWLKILDKWNLFYSYSDLVKIVRKGIKDKYKLEPEQVLSIIYTVYAKTGISGANDGIYNDLTGEWVDWKTGEVLSVTDQASANTLATNVAKGDTSGGGFWNGLKKVVDYIVDLLDKLGITEKKQTFTKQTPTGTDWSFARKTDYTEYLPYIVVGGIALYFLTKKKKTTTTKQ